MKLLSNLIWTFLLLFAISACGQLKSDLFGSSKEAGPFLVDSSSFNVNIRYEENAAPFTGTLGNGRDIWSVLRFNLRQALPSSIREINVQSQIGQMTALKSFGVSSWSKERLEKMAFDSTFAKSGLTNNTITAVFLQGKYSDNQKAMGIHFHGSSVVFIFKGVVQSLGFDRRQMAGAEQSTLVHEIGHALGLVDGYVPMTSGPHEDPVNKNHCTNPNCVMYKRSDGLQALDKLLTGSSQQSLGLFGQECLTDLHNFYNNVSSN